MHLCCDSFKFQGARLDYDVHTQNSPKFYSEVKLSNLSECHVADMPGAIARSVDGGVVQQHRVAVLGVLHVYLHSFKTSILGETDSSQRVLRIASAVAKYGVGRSDVREVTDAPLYPVANAESSIEDVEEHKRRETKQKSVTVQRQCKNSCIVEVREEGEGGLHRCCCLY